MSSSAAIKAGRPVVTRGLQALIRWHPDPEEARYQAVHVQMWTAVAVSCFLGAGMSRLLGGLWSLWLGFGAGMVLASLVVARWPYFRNRLSVSIYVVVMGFAVYTMLVLRNDAMALMAVWATLASAGVAESPRRGFAAALGGMAVVLAILYMTPVSVGGQAPLTRFDLVAPAVLVLGAMALAAYLGSTQWQRAFSDLRVQVARHDALTAEIAADNEELEARVRTRTQELELRTSELTARTQELRRSLTHQSELRRELYELSVRDDLTGLHNRRYLLKTLDQALGSPQPVYMLIIDVDHFKRVNDTLGHPQGDVVLTMIARALAVALRTDDSIGRLGGEEFGVVLTGSDRGAAYGVAENLRRAVAEIEWTGDTAGPAVTVSIGVSEAGPTTSAGTLLGEADHALYRAKAGGRNRVVVSEPGPPRQPEARCLPRQLPTGQS